MSSVLFFIAAAGVISGAVGVVVLRNPFYSVLALVGHLLSLAVLFLLLRAEFVAAVQVVIYAGAVLAGALLVELLIALLGTGLEAIDGEGAGYSPGPQAFGTPAYIGKLLLTRFLLVFEVASFLLLIAAVGGVVLARRRKGLEEEDDGDLLTPMGLLRPSDTGTMAEGVGARVAAPRQDAASRYGP